MAMVCPQCKEWFQQRLDCPKCGARLIYQPGGPGHDPSDPLSSDHWQQTPWGRLLVGLLLAQGLFYIFHHLCTAGFLVVRPDSDNVWSALTGLVLLQAIQAVSVLAAGLLSGAGQRRGMFLGLVVGVWNGVLFTVSRHWLGYPLTTISLFGEPALQAAIGAVGGLAGSVIWKPLSPLRLPGLLQGSGPAPAISVRPRRSAFAGPLYWGRVLTGTTLTVGCIVWVDVIREFVLEASEGKLRIDTHLQAELVTWEISAVAMLVGGAFAGATTSNGTKQGIAVGTASGVILLGIRLANNLLTPQLLILTLASTIALCLVGGWFGGELLPPIIRAAKRHRRRHPAPI
jgi:hypothetical protein